MYKYRHHDQCKKSGPECFKRLVTNGANNRVCSLHHGHDECHCHEPNARTANTTTTLASANERLLLAAYIALTCASPDDDSAATEKPTLVNALPMVTNAQSQNKRDFIRRIICRH